MNALLDRPSRRRLAALAALLAASGFAVAFVMAAFLTVAYAMLYTVLAAALDEPD